MKRVQIVLLVLFCSTFIYGSEKSQLIITVYKARAYQSASAYSKQLRRLPFGGRVQVTGMKGNWVKVQLPDEINAFVHKDTLIDKKGFDRQRKAVQKRKDKEVKGGVSGFSEDDEVAAATKGFSEDDEIAAATKGFSEEEEVAAATKGFSEDDEVAAATKGFNPQVEEEYKKMNQGLKY
ncbi:MAG: SH3 domain-containing protein, partial [Spirochaetota bacterium]|nr:SH3 domain-containing protein [Spirochaetota bacterium]